MKPPNAPSRFLGGAMNPVRSTDSPAGRQMVYIRSARFGRKYRRLMLFGSRARGDNDPESDADVAVILRGHIGDRWSVNRLIIEDTYPILLETGLYIQA
jgi:predicted nucleotidyltransferase